MMEEALKLSFQGESTGSALALREPIFLSSGRSAVEPFRIICETCRSRLKIRTPDVIGEIHACPKCGSMVQIVPPAGWNLGESSPAIVEPFAVNESVASTTGSMFIPASALEDMAAIAAALETPAPPLAAPPLPEVVPAPAPAPVAAKSLAMWWSLGGAAAVLMVGGLAWAIWPSGNKPVAPSPGLVAKDASPAPAPSDQPKSTTPHVELTSEQSKAPSDEPADTKATEAAIASNVKEHKPEAAPLETTKLAMAEPAAVATKANAAAAPIAAPPREKPQDVAAGSVKSATTAPAPKNLPPAAAPKIADVAAAPDHSPVLKFDPLDFDPDRLGASSKSPGESNTLTSSVPDKLPAEPATENIPAADTGFAPPAPGAPVAQDAGAPPRIANASITVRRGPPSEAPVKTASQLLASRVRALQVTDMPLVRFVETLSGVAGAGVTLDPIALEQVGISPQATVSVNAQDAPLKDVLHDALSQRRLDVGERGGQLRVVLPSADESHTFDYDVTDLAANGDGAAVGQLIENFVQPATWKPSGGKGTLEAKGNILHIKQSDAARREIIVFCERLRMARSLSVKSKYPAAMLSIESPYHRLSAKLDERATFTFLPWTRLADVAHGWQEMTGLLVLVDWGALSEAELGPASPIACSSLERSWQESLDGVLEPLGLGWWAVNGDTIQITTLAALEKIQRIEFYTVPASLRSSAASSQALIELLTNKLAETGGKEDMTAPCHMELDEPSGRLIVLATPKAHRHLTQRLIVGATHQLPGASPRFGDQSGR
jgi:hypothetical protein